MLQQVGAECGGLLRHVLPFLGFQRQQRERSLRADLGKDNEGVLFAIHLDCPIVLKDHLGQMMDQREQGFVLLAGWHCGLVDADGLLFELLVQRLFVFSRMYWLACIRSGPRC